MKIILLFLFLLASLISSCSRDTAYIPREGDLLFVMDASSDFSKAITDATAWNDSLKYSHVAIVAVEDGKPYVLEASNKHGVVHTEWDDFMGTSVAKEDKSKIVIMRLTAVGFPVEQTIERAKSHLGKPYDWSFLPDNGKFYCSELVYDGDRPAAGTPLFTATPMNFRDADGNMPAYWLELFDRLGEPVPEGVPGTNPNDLAKEPILTVVYTQ